MTPPPESRERLREYLTERLTALGLGEPSHESLALERLLQEAIDGLIALDHGEARAIFKKTKVKSRFTKPATIREYKLRAVGYVDLLHRLGLSKEKARFMVAEAHGVSDQYIKNWYLALGKDTSPEALITRAESYISYNLSKLGHPFSEAILVAEMKRMGQALKRAKIPKRPTKKTTSATK